MKKWSKILRILLCNLVILCVIFFVVDVIRVNGGNEPLFCLLTATYKDGGTRKYLGLGYKVQLCKQIEGCHKAHIGTWFMQPHKSNSSGPEGVQTTQVPDTVTPIENVEL